MINVSVNPFYSHDVGGARKIANDERSSRLQKYFARVEASSSSGSLV